MNPWSDPQDYATLKDLVDYWEAHGGKLKTVAEVRAEMEDWLTHRQPLPPEDRERSFAE